MRSNTSTPRYLNTSRGAVALSALALFAAGCHTDMWVQPKYQEPLSIEKSPNGAHVFPDSSVARPLVPGTVARDHLETDSAFYTGFANGKLVDQFPIPVTKELILRGQDRFSIYCVPCHGQIGNGQGMIAQRGFELRRPVGNYHTDRLRKMPIGHFFDVITNGYGAMFSYASRIEPQDRWAICAYIRVLQLSQHADVKDLNAEQVKELNSNPTPATPAPAGTEQSKP
ncbi:MAG TPA: cytochrome c [Fimbriimonadaceae bacterium]|nr:cytochrome c [Fimbriimonadaceae bacterium]